MLTIARASTPDDIAAVKLLLRGMVAHFREQISEDLEDDAFDREVEGPDAEFAGPVGFMLLARLDGEPVGTLGLRVLPEKARLAGANPGAVDSASDPAGADSASTPASTHPAADPDAVELRRMFVAPAARRRGIARALILAMIDEARAAGHQRLLLVTVPAFASAVALYQSLGFEYVPPFRTSTAPDAVFMALEL